MNTRTLRLLGVLLATLMALAACGDDEDVADDIEDTVTEPLDEAAEEVDEEVDEVEEAVDETEVGEAEMETEMAAGDTWMGVEGNVNISGSSTVEPVSARVAELLQDVNSDVDVTVSGPGTGDGFQLFCSGETDISDASRPISEEEVALCEENGIDYTELQVAYDGIAILANPANPVECVSFEDMYGLMSAEAEQAGVDDWSDAESLEGLEINDEFPDAPLDISAPGTESGTYDSFIEIVLEDLAEERGFEDEPIRTDFAGQADDNIIIQGIAGSDSSFGWVGFAFAEANADVVKTLAVDGGEGCVDDTFESIADGSYPVSRTLYIYVNTAKAAENPALVGYVDYYLSDEAYEDAVINAFGPEQGYIPLPSDTLDEVRSTWESAKP